MFCAAGACRQFVAASERHSMCGACCLDRCHYLYLSWLEILTSDVLFVNQPAPRKMHDHGSNAVLLYHAIQHEQLFLHHKYPKIHYLLAACRDSGQYIQQKLPLWRMYVPDFTVHHTGKHENIIHLHNLQHSSKSKQ